jgi:hypothetical protein
MSDDDLWQEMDRKFEEIKRQMQTRPEWVDRMQFASVTWSKGRLYVGREEYVGGPRILLFPLQEVEIDVEPCALGQAVLEALDGYIVGDRVVYVEEKQEMNKQFLRFFGFRSIPEFYRKSIDVTIRRENTDAGDIFSLGFGDTGEEMQPCPGDPEGLGRAILEKIRGDRRYREIKSRNKK